jgi:hypothetical protein
MFYGLVIYMYVLDNQQHNEPHIHVKYQGEFTVLRIPDGEILAGNLPNKKLNLVKAWITIHEEDLLADWDLAVNGELPHKLEPLK